MCVIKIKYNYYIALPTAPTDVIISEVTATSVRLEWSYKGPEDLQYYVIQYKPKNANQVTKTINIIRDIEHICVKVYMYIYEILCGYI